MIPASTAFHAQDLGFRTILIDDCSRGINNDNITNCFEKIKNSFGCVVQSSEVRTEIVEFIYLQVLFSHIFSQVKAMVQGHDRRPALGVILARKCRDRLSYPPNNPNSKLQSSDKQNNN